jgi:hypothetical protein
MKSRIAKLRILEIHLNISYNQAMHRMPNPPLRYGFVTGDGGRYAEWNLSD